MAGGSLGLALVAISDLVVNKLRPLAVTKRKGRRSWDGGPSGLLLLQTPGLAERKVGRPLRLRDRAYQLAARPSNSEAAHGHNRILALKLLPRLDFFALLDWLGGRIHVKFLVG